MRRFLLAASSIVGFILFVLVMPFYGAWQLSATGNAGWIFAMLPLLVLMEGGIGLGILFFIVVGILQTVLA